MQFEFVNINFINLRKRKMLLFLTIKYLLYLLSQFIFIVYFEIIYCAKRNIHALFFDFFRKKND